MDVILLIQIFLQVKTSKEDTKSGTDTENVEHLYTLI